MNTMVADNLETSEINAMQDAFFLEIEPIDIVYHSGLSICHSLYYFVMNVNH